MTQPESLTPDVSGSTASGSTAAPADLAPAAPGRIGVTPSFDELLPYLDAVGTWLAHRKDELDRLDAAALRSADPQAYTSDVVLAMSLWQAAGDRTQAILAVWDSGRADRAGRDRIAQLIWGRLDAGLGAGLAVSFVEACRLSDALTGQLRARLALDPAAAEAPERLAAVRAELERCREMDAGPAADPAMRARLDRLGTRLAELTRRAGMGADITGPLRELEGEAAVAERDLIVAVAGLRNLARDRERARELVNGLLERGQSVRELARRCADRIVAPPRLAVPDVSALGPVPEDRAQLTAYLGRLDQVRRAMDLAEATYAAPLAERNELRGRIDGYRAMAVSQGRAEDPALSGAYQAARAVLWTAPCDLSVARQLVSGYQSLVRASAEQPSPEEPSPEQPSPEEPSPEQRGAETRGSG